MQRNHLYKKGYKQFLVKNEIGAIGIFFVFDIFFNFNFFHVFLVKVLNIHSSKTFFWLLSSNFTIFSCKMSVTFESN